MGSTATSSVATADADDASPQGGTHRALVMAAQVVARTVIDEAARRAWVRSQLTPAERRMVRVLDAFDRVRVWIVARFPRR